MPRTGLVPAPPPSGPTMQRQRRELEKRPGTGDWTTQTTKLTDEAKAFKAQSRQIRGANAAVKKAGEREVVDMQAVVNEELKRKVAQTGQLKAKLEKQLVETAAELTLQVEERARTKERLDARRRPLRVATKRQEERTERPTVEQINDAVERTLHAETIELQQSTTQLAQLVKASGEIVTALEQSKRVIEADLADKARSLDLDRQCLECGTPQGSPHMDRSSDQLLQTNIGVMLTESKALASQRAPNAPERWKKSTVQCMATATELVQRSQRHRKVMRAAIQTLQASNQQAKIATDDALRTKLKQIQTLLTSLQSHLKSVNEELDELYRNRESIQKTLQQKEGPLNILRQRLAIRKQRPDREAVLDSVEEALGKELAKLKTTMEGLATKLKACDVEIVRLNILKKKLEQEVVNKTAALAHDRRALQIDVHAVSSEKGSNSKTATAFANQFENTFGDDLDRISQRSIGLPSVGSGLSQRSSRSLRSTPRGSRTA